MEGQLIAGKYRLSRLLGKGSMGSVWLAEHLTLQTPVAIKLIRVEAANNAKARTRFDREAQIVARIRSAHVVKVLDHGLTEQGLSYIAMECLTGESLRARLRTRGRLTPAETAKVVSHVCRALSRAHEAGLVHRDLKPENLFMAQEDDGEIVKVLDFGVAKVTDLLAASGMDPTRTGALLGTPYYMSPEQAQGLKSVDYRSDLWSVGVLAFECLTGKRPFTAPALGPLIAMIVETPPPAVSATAPNANIAPEIDTWMRKALARDPAERFGSAKELSEAFMVATGAVDTMDSGAAVGPERVTAPSIPHVASEVSADAATVHVPPTLDKQAPGGGTVVLPGAPVTAGTVSAVATSPAAAAPVPVVALVAPKASRSLVWALIVMGIALLGLGGALAAVLLR